MASKKLLWTPTYETRLSLGIKIDQVCGQTIEVEAAGFANVIVDGRLRHDYHKIMYRGVEYIVPVRTLDLDESVVANPRTR